MACDPSTTFDWLSNGLGISRAALDRSGKLSSRFQPSKTPRSCSPPSGVGYMRLLLECSCSQGSGALNSGAAHAILLAMRDGSACGAFGRVDTAHRAAKPGLLFDSPSNLRI